MGMQPHCLNSMDCSEFYGGCENCRRTDGVSIEDYDENGVIESVGFLKPEHTLIATSGSGGWIKTGSDMNKLVAECPDAVCHINDNITGEYITSFQNGHEYEALWKYVQVG